MCATELRLYFTLTDGLLCVNERTLNIAFCGIVPTNWWMGRHCCSDSGMRNDKSTHDRVWMLSRCALHGIAHVLLWESKKNVFADAMPFSEYHASRWHLHYPNCERRALCCFYWIIENHWTIKRTFVLCRLSHFSSPSPSSSSFYSVSRKSQLSLTKTMWKKTKE